MKTSKSKVGLTTIVTLLATMTLTETALAARRVAVPRDRDYSGYQFADSRDTNVLTSSTSSGVRFKSNALSDTFCIYGGPGEISEGKFQTITGVVPDVLNHAQGCYDPPLADKWLGVDLTDQPTMWQVTDGAIDPPIQACIETLGGNGSGNHAAWCGRSSTQEPTWITAPGYGNGWNALLEWRRTVGNPSVGQTVDLSFVFHHDSEPGYDFFIVEYDSFNASIPVYSVDGSNDPFAAPGRQFPQDVSPAAIVYGAGGYSGLSNDEIVLRLRGSSDLAWSDQDGLFPTECGLAMLDDITVSYSDGSTFDDFESGFGNWDPAKAPFAGDFSHIYPRMSDVDPCRENQSPVAMFVDTGQCPVNDSNNCGVDPCQSTGGSTSATWSYGVPGGWVVNYQGGLSYGLTGVMNEIWSPPIAWDLPGSEDDAPEIAGSDLRISVYWHLPVLNGIFWVWHVRSSIDGGATWSPFADRNFVYFAGIDGWINSSHVVSDLVSQDSQRPDFVQIALGVWDIAGLFAFPGNDATPSPAFDNVSFYKFRVDGPFHATRNIDLFMDAFPQSGASDFTTLAGRQAADCRIDMRDVSSGALNVPGDSMCVDVTAVIPGTTLDRVDLIWIMDKNPKFDDVRLDPATIGASVIPAGAANGWDQWTGSVPADTAKIGNVPVQDRFFFDLPDEDFAHPGDVIRFYVESEDSDGHVATLPVSTDGFATGRGSNGQLYATPFSLHFVPSAVDDGAGGWTQPSVLVVNDHGHAGGHNDYYQAFEQNGWRRGVEWDMYTTSGAASCKSNGIGSAGAHGATPDQLARYETILYFAGYRSACLLSDGSNTAGDDKGDDIGTLTGWFQSPQHASYLAHFADDIASAVLEASPGAGGTYVATIMGVQLLDNIVRGDINGQGAPIVVPASGSPWFHEEFVAFGACDFFEHEFDNIGPLGEATQSHFFLDLEGHPYPANGARAASVTNSYTDHEGNPKVSITFPFGFISLWNKSGSVRGGPNPPAGTGEVSSRAIFLRELIEDRFGAVMAGSAPTGVSDRVAFRDIRNLRTSPNPFNPATTISFELGAREFVSLDVYDLRGSHVTSLHEGIMEAGLREIVWRGEDARGARVASGVYVARVRTPSMTRSIKVMVLK